MKVAIYIQDGMMQLVLTPEGEWEKSVIDKVAKQGLDKVKMFHGSFFECRGGWTRYDIADESDTSLILRVDKEKEKE